jgi:hypothetical protein
MDTSFHKSPNNFKSAAISSSDILTLEYRTKVSASRILKIRTNNVNDLDRESYQRVEF